MKVLLRLMQNIYRITFDVRIVAQKGSQSNSIFYSCEQKKGSRNNLCDYITVILLTQKKSLCANNFTLSCVVGIGLNTL